MRKVTFYLDNETENQLKKAAKSSQLSVSKWVAGVIEEKLMTEWPQEVVKLVLRPKSFDMFSGNL
jgi:hypothetical protein